MNVTKSANVGSKKNDRKLNSTLGDISSLNKNIKKSKLNVKDWNKVCAIDESAMVLHKNKVRDLHVKVVYDQNLIDETDVRGRVTKMDVKIGERMKSLRTLLGLTQSTVSSMLGLTFQQIQKYEQGVNRISASTLWRLAVHFGMPLESFFPSLNSNEIQNKVAVNDAASDDSYLHSVLNGEHISKETANLLRCYYGIKNIKIRKKVMSLISSIAIMGDETE